MKAPSLAEALASPLYLLHRVDPTSDRLIFVPTTRRVLSETSFIDGRTVLGAGPELPFRLSDALALTGPNRRRRIASFFTSPSADRPCSPGCSMSRANPLSPGSPIACEPVVVKPSNWINNLLPELCAPSPGVTPFFVTMERRAFLTAVSGAGGTRLACTARTAAHLRPRTLPRPPGRQSCGGSIGPAGPGRQPRRARPLAASSLVRGSAGRGGLGSGSAGRFQRDMRGAG